MEGSSGLSVLASLCRKAGRRGLHAAGLPQSTRSVAASESRRGTGVYPCHPCSWTVPQLLEEPMILHLTDKYYEGMSRDDDESNKKGDH